MRVISIKLKDIQQNENSRVIYKSVDLAELMATMKKDGLLEPVGVRKLPSGKYDAVFGNRRILAAKKLGWDEIAAHVLNVKNDTDRDIINLIENMKRQNTSVAEDGRVFQNLVDKKLSIDEISARLGVHKARIQTALDVFNEFPSEFKGLIVNKARGQIKNGKIGAHSAFLINNIRKTHGLNRKQTRTLLHGVQKQELGQTQLHAVAPLLKSGHTLSQSLSMVQKIDLITLNLKVDRDHVSRLEKKHKKTIHELCYDAIESVTALKAVRATDRNVTADPHKSVRREMREIREN